MSFRLFDLRSQALAVQKELLGKSVAEKLEWVRVRGRLEGPYNGSYHFTSHEGVESIFWFDGDQIVFLGDHCTFVVTEDSDPKP